MKRLLALCLSLLLVLPLVSCHSHVWTEATCTAARTCAECGATEGEPLGHRFAEADCTTPETCSVCGITQGEPAGHVLSEATCSAAAICSTCGDAQGEPLAHTLTTEATCTEPAFCSSCNAAAGEPLGHDWVGPTLVAPKVCTRCQLTEGDVATFFEHETLMPLIFSYYEKAVVTLDAESIKDYTLDYVGLNSDGRSDIYLFTSLSQTTGTIRNQISFDDSNTNVDSIDRITINYMGPDPTSLDAEELDDFSAQLTFATATIQALLGIESYEEAFAITERIIMETSPEHPLKVTDSLQASLHAYFDVYQPDDTTDILISLVFELW